MDLTQKCIYKATSLVDGKIYIGQTNNLERRIREHKAHALKDGGPFHEAIRLYGLRNFKFDILEYCRSDLSDARERFYIAQFRKVLGTDAVYNYCDGGLGGQTHDVCGANNPSFGKSYSDEERKTLSEKLKGKKKPDGFGERISKSLRGRPKSREQVMKKSHPVSVINVNSGEILHFDSKTEMERALKCCMSTIVKGRITHNGYKLYESEIGLA